MTLWLAARQRTTVKRLSKVCNTAQNKGTTRRRSPVYGFRGPLGPWNKHNVYTISICIQSIRSDPFPNASVSLQMGWLSKRRMNWIYTVRFIEMKAFIQAGILHCSNFRDQDIETWQKRIPLPKDSVISRAPGFYAIPLQDGRPIYRFRRSNYRPSPTWSAVSWSMLCGGISPRIWARRLRSIFGIPEPPFR